MFCPNCGNEILPGSKFCGNCGYPVGEQITGSAQEAQSVSYAAQEPWEQPDIAAASGNAGAGAGFEQQAPRQPAGFEQPKPPKKKNTGLIIALSIIGAVLALLVILAVVGIILLRKASSVVYDDDLIPGSLEEILEEEQSTIEGMIEEAVEDIESIPELIDVPADDQDVLNKESQVAAAYLDVLKEHKDRIRGYIWQDDFAENDWDDRGISIPENRPVILADIGGDETKELIILESVDDEWAAMYASNLHVFGYDADKGEVTDLMETMLDVQAGGGTYYALFTVENDKGLYLYKSWGDETWTDSFIRYEAIDGGLEETYNLSMSTEPDENYEEILWNYSENEAEITEEDYEARKAALIDSIDKVYCWNLIVDEAMQEKLKDVSAAAFTYSEAVDELKAEAGDLAPEEETEELLNDEEAELWLGALGSHTRTFMFSSGAGGWWTELTLNADGTFTGNFQDSDMGDSRAQYGVQYISHFAGRFSALTKIDDYKYSMTIEELTTEETVGDEWEEDGILYIASEPYGLDGGETFYLYLPGQSTSDLPAEYVEWVRMPMGYDAMPEYLPFYGIYNEKAECGFFSTDY